MSQLLNRTFATTALAVLLSLAIALPAVATHPHEVVVPWGSNWDYAIVEAGGCAGVADLLFVGQLCALSPGTAPFGNNDGGCGTGTVNTAWNAAPWEATDLLATQVVVMPSGTSQILVDYKADDRLWIYVNGVSAHTSGELGGCGLRGSSDLIEVPAAFTIEIRVRDYFGDVPGNLAYFDAQITAS